MGSVDSASEQREEKKEVNPMNGSFEGPLTKCLEEDDEILYDADKYVPNDTTIRIKVYLPNKKPLFVIVKKDATVQDTIEMTIPSRTPSPPRSRRRTRSGRKLRRRVSTRRRRSNRPKPIRRLWRTFLSPHLIMASTTESTTALAMVWMD